VRTSATVLELELPDQQAVARARGENSHIGGVHCARRQVAVRLLASRTVLLTDRARVGVAGVPSAGRLHTVHSR
jgi:hypothetical protein